MKEILIEFLLELNKKGLINNYDFDYEKEAKDFVKRKEQTINTICSCKKLNKDKVVRYEDHKDEWNKFLSQKK